MLCMLLLRIDLSIFNMIWIHNPKTKKFYYNRNNRCNNYKVFAIRCYCNDKKLLQAVVIISEAIGLYNKKNLIAINPKHRKLCS